MKNKLKRKNLRIEDASFFFILFSFFFSLEEFFFSLRKKSFIPFHFPFRLETRGGTGFAEKKKRENTDRDRNADKIGNSWR